MLMKFKTVISLHEYATTFNKIIYTEEIGQFVAGLKLAELREELKKHNQPMHGNKAALG